MMTSKQLKYSRTERKMHRREKTSLESPVKELSPTVPIQNVLGSTSPVYVETETEDGDYNNDLEECPSFVAESQNQSLLLPNSNMLIQNEQIFLEPVMQRCSKQNSAQFSVSEKTIRGGKKRGSSRAVDFSSLLAKAW